MSAPEVDLVTGIAEALAAAGVAAWSPDTEHTGTGPVVAIGDAPDGPDRAVTLTAYVLQDDPHHADALYGVQVRIRGTRDPRTVWDVAQQVRDLFHGRAGFTLGTVPVTECHRQASAQLGRDENGRWEQADTYHLQTNTPTAHRPF